LNALGDETTNGILYIEAARQQLYACSSFYPLMTTTANKVLAASEAYMAVKLDLDRGGNGIEIMSRFRQGVVIYFTAKTVIYIILVKANIQSLW
jgi:hypothetical protein